MATQKRTTKLLPGHAAHTNRTQDSYMGALLDEVSIDDWREVVKATVTLAKGGDPQARAWLGLHLIGRPETKAPAAVNVIVNQLQSKDEVLDKLTSRTFMDARFHDADDDVKANIRAQLAIEIADKLQQQSATQ